MQNKFFKQAPKVEHIPTQKVKVNVNLVKKGYINLISRRKGATAIVKKGIAKVVKFATKKALQAYQILDKQRNEERLNENFKTSFLKSALLESHILTAKNEFKKALFNLANGYELAKLNIEIAKAYLHAKTFKYSLPRTIRFNLF